MQRREFMQLALTIVVLTAIPSSAEKLPSPMVWSNQAPTSITFAPGATTGQRLVIDATGITAYDNSNNVIFKVAVGSSSGAFVQNFAIINSLDNIIAQLFANPANSTKLVFQFTDQLNIIGQAGPGVLILGGGNTEVQFGSGEKGRYYKGAYAPSVQVIPNAADTQLINLTVIQENNDYAASPLNNATGVWTCPEDSYYSGSFTAGFAAHAATIDARVNLGALPIAVNDNPSNSNIVQCSFSSVFISAGQTVTWHVTQTSGAGLAMAPGISRISIGRDL